MPLYRLVCQFGNLLRCLKPILLPTIGRYFKRPSALRVKMLAFRFFPRVLENSKPCVVRVCVDRHITRKNKLTKYLSIFIPYKRHVSFYTRIGLTYFIILSQVASLKAGAECVRSLFIIPHFNVSDNIRFALRKSQITFCH